MQPPLFNLPNNPQFETFWEAYPKKEAKFAARRAFEKAIRMTELNTMLQAIQNQKATDQWIRGFIPHPATWLNGGCWLNEITPYSPPAKPVWVLEKELANIQTKIDQVRGTYTGLQNWSEADRVKFNELVKEKKRLKELLSAHTARLT